MDGDVEGGGGLVRDEESGLVDDGHRYEDALALSSGKLVWIVFGAVLWIG